MLDEVFGSLSAANKLYASRRPGVRTDRQPVHTVYGGAQLFKADTARKMGQVALNHLQEYAPDFIDFAHAFRLPGSGSLATSGEIKQALLRAVARNADSLKSGHAGGWLAATVYHRVVNKLRSEPVEDFRIDFEDGFGVRTDDEEDAEARRTAEEVATGMQDGGLPPFIGIRIKPLNEENRDRAVRTLDLFLTTLLRASGGQLPQNFVVTLPKVTIPAQVAALAQICDMIESAGRLEPGTLKIELMIETPTSILDDGGRSALHRIVQAAEDRCIAAHFGVYDYTASLEIAASQQTMGHAACEFARHVMQTTLAGTGIWISDGATNIMPVGPHKTSSGTPPLTPQQEAENREVVHRAWRLAYEDTTRSLESGFYQGWDLHPAQLSARYTAVYTFFLKSLDSAAHRLATFVDKAARATLVGDIFDDAATGQGLLNFFLRALNCGAITVDEAMKTGLTIDELKSRSFVKIVEDRAAFAVNS